MSQIVKTEGYLLSYHEWRDSSVIAEFFTKD